MLLCLRLPFVMCGRRVSVGETGNRLCLGRYFDTKNLKCFSALEVLKLKERETAHEVRWTSVLRGPKRSVENRTLRHGCASITKRTSIRMSFLLSKSARRGSNPRPPPWQGGAPPLSHSRIKY